MFPSQKKGGPSGADGPEIDAEALGTDIIEIVVCGGRDDGGSLPDDPEDDNVIGQGWVHWCIDVLLDDKPHGVEVCGIVGLGGRAFFVGDGDRRVDGHPAVSRQIIPGLEVRVRCFAEEHLVAPDGAGRDADGAAESLLCVPSPGPHP